MKKSCKIYIEIRNQSNVCLTFSTTDKIDLKGVKNIKKIQLTVKIELNCCFYMPLYEHIYKYESKFKVLNRELNITSQNSILKSDGSLKNAFSTIGIVNFGLLFVKKVYDNSNKEMQTAWPT